MKKNLMSVLILALVLVNLILTGILTITILPQTKKSNELVNKVCSAIDLELESGDGTESASIPMDHIVTYKIEDAMTINLKTGADGETHYVKLTASISMDSKNDGYKTYGEDMADRETILKDTINSVINTYTMDEFNSNVKPAIEKLLNSTDIQAQKDTNKDGLFTIKTRNFKDNEFEEMKDMLVKDYKAVDDKQNFTNTKISDTVSKEMRSDAVVATVLATICMLFYIWIRFKNIHFALAAVMALIHDVLIVIGFYALSRVTVGTTFIACMLTIVGYSINATIVIFDRIRENKAVMKRDDKMIEIVDRSITQTLTRSIYTTLTTFVMVFMIFIMGVSSIREFTLPLMTGMIAGAFSSVFITGSLWYVLKGKKSDK